MSLHGFLLFCLVYVLATASPGPGIAAIVARVLSGGAEGLAPFVAGFVVGDLIWFTLAAAGIAALAQAAHTLFLIVKYAGAVYLLYLAYQLWIAPTQAIPEADDQPRQRATQSFFASFALTMGNPKVMVFFLALLPTVIDLRKLTVRNFLEIAVAICLILSCVLTLYSFAALRARKLFKNPRAIRWLNRGAGTVMAGAAAAVATQ